MSQAAAISEEYTASGAVRVALDQGRPQETLGFLQTRSITEAIVEHGDARGRAMGFPTANMHLKEGYPLAFGIYAVRVAVLKVRTVESLYDGVANFGLRPMYRITRPLLEVHLFDFDGDLYGMTLRVEFVAFLRPEASFPSLDALIAQINEDARKARRLLRRAPHLASSPSQDAARSEIS
jgi:riboflavin kinase/FMN adenylyltransferase